MAPMGRSKVHSQSSQTVRQLARHGVQNVERLLNTRELSRGHRPLEFRVSRD